MTSVLEAQNGGPEVSDRKLSIPKVEKKDGEQSPVEPQQNGNPESAD
jgi:hypothetical protein